jgi:hypothetical protein
MWSFDHELSTHYNNTSGRNGGCRSINVRHVLADKFAALFNDQFGWFPGRQWDQRIKWGTKMHRQLKQSNFFVIKILIEL